MGECPSDLVLFGLNVPNENQPTRPQVKETLDNLQQQLGHPGCHKGILRPGVGRLRGYPEIPWAISAIAESITLHDWGVNNYILCATTLQKRPDGTWHADQNKIPVFGPAQLRLH